jgi:hypothetical protein
LKSDLSNIFSREKDNEDLFVNNCLEVVVSTYKDVLREAEERWVTSFLFFRKTTFLTTKGERMKGVQREGKEPPEIEGDVEPSELSFF